MQFPIRKNKAIHIFKVNSDIVGGLSGNGIPMDRDIPKFAPHT